MGTQIFVVEPNLNRRIHLELRLMEEGYAVQTFDSATSFVGAYPNGADHCCIVVNAELPDMCGIELLEWLRSHGCSAQGLVICPPSADVELAVRGMRAGAVDFIDDDDPQARIVERLTELLKCPCSSNRAHQLNHPHTHETRLNPPPLSADHPAPATTPQAAPSRTSSKSTTASPRSSKSPPFI